MVVFTDKRINQCINDSVRYYRADLRSAYDYYPFGMLIPDRTFDSVAYVQLPERVDTTISQRIKIQIPSLNPGQNITLTKDGETYVLAQYQSGYTGAQYSATIAGSAIVNELSFEDSSGYLIIENTTLGGQKICSGIPSFSLHIAGTNYVVNCSQSIDTIRGGLLSEVGYLFGFNGQERNDEIAGLGNSIVFEFRIYDSRLGRFLSIDPLEADYPWYTPYQFAGNTPIMAMDLEGAEPLISTDYKTIKQLNEKVFIFYGTCHTVGGHIYYTLTLVHNYKNGSFDVTIQSNQTSQEDLKNSFFRIVYLFEDTKEAYYLNKIRNLSYRDENKRGMAIKDMANHLQNQLIGVADYKIKQSGRPEGINNMLLHVMGQALLTALYGQDIANLAAEMHEVGNTGLITGKYGKDETSDVINNYCDMINNIWGQKWGLELREELGLSSSVNWTTEQTASFLNGLIKRISESTGLNTNYEYCPDDLFVIDYTKFINETK